VAFSAMHFPLHGNDAKLTELIRVGNKMTQNLGLKYFWVSASCLRLDEDEERLSLDEQARIGEQDVSTMH
jgi:hypothetical protein